MRKSWIWFLYLLSVGGGAQVAFAQQGIDSQVKEAIQKSFQNSKELQVKSLELDKTEMEAAEVKGKKLPHVEATGLYGFLYSNGSLDLPTWTIPGTGLGLFEGASNFSTRTQAAYAGVSVKQILFSGTQIPNGEKAIAAKAEAQTHLVQASRETMAKDILTTFDQVMLLHEVDKLIIDSEKRLKKEQVKVNQAIANGLAIPYDRDKLKLALLELESKKVELAGARNLLVKKLRQETGLSEEEILHIQYQLDAMPIAEMPQDAQQRSELQALTASGKAYDFLYKKEKGGALPMFFAFGSASYLNIFDTHLNLKSVPLLGNVDLKANSLQGRPNLMVGVGAKWEIFSGGEHKSKIRQRQLDQEINQVKLRDTEEKLNLLLEKNKVSYQNANQKLNVGQQQLKVAENSLVMASKQYQAGLIAVTDFLASENDWYRVNLGYYSTIIEQRAAALELLHSAGKLLQTIYE